MPRTRKAVILAELLKIPAHRVPGLRVEAMVGALKEYWAGNSMAASGLGMICSVMNACRLTMAASLATSWAVAAVGAAVVLSGAGTWASVGCWLAGGGFMLEIMGDVDASEDRNGRCSGSDRANRLRLVLDEG